MLIAMAAIVFAACKKEDDDNTPGTNKTKTEMITTGSWITYDMLLNGVSFWGLTDPCSKDDFLIFKTGGVVVTDEGPTKCDPGDPQTTNGTWSLSSDEKKITLDGDVADITDLTDVNMVISMQDSTDFYVIKMKKK